MNITDWLRGLSLGRYEETLRDNAIELEVLPELSEADLEKLGILRAARRDWSRQAMERTGGRAAARDLLATVYGLVHRGSDAAHLKDAKALLDQLV